MAPKTGIPGLMDHLRALAPEPWTEHPILVRVTIDRDAATQQTLARHRDMEEWAWRSEDTYELLRFEYLVREWSFEAVYMLRARAPSTAPVQLVTIGRSRRCDVCIEDESISRLHAVMYWHRDRRRYLLQDRDSRHGTLVDGESIPPGQLWSPGQFGVVTLGSATFVFIEPHLLRLLATNRP